MQLPIMLPLLVGRLDDRLVASGSRIVDQDVGPTERLDGIDQRLAAAGGRDVARDRNGFHAMPVGNFLRPGLQPLRLACRHHQVNAFLRQGAGHSEAYADAGAGDYCHLSVQVHVHACLSPSYLTIGIFERSIVIATAAIRTIPNTMFWAKMLTPRNVIPI